MTTLRHRFPLLHGLLGIALLLPACGEKKSEGLTIWWAKWAPANGLQELGREFEKETGIPVRVHQIPWSSYQDKAFQEFGSRETAFDIIIGDSQWIGYGASRGLYLELTDWLRSSVDMTSVHPRAARYLCEYPTGSGRFFAAPCETDAMGFAYRKDWFADPAEQAAFRGRFGRELAPPATWQEFRDIAEFFTRPDAGRFGAAIVTGRDYDETVMGFEQVLYAFGGAWCDEATKRVVGFLDSPAAVRALEFYIDLLRFAPPGGTRMGYPGVLEPFENGSVALCMNYFAFFPDLFSRMGDRVGFFAMPSGPERRAASLGGQGFSISTRIPPEKQELAKRFIAWFQRQEIQEQWIRKPAGFTANTAVLQSEAFRNATPYNAPFADSLEFLQDFWNVPVFGELLSPAQRLLGEAIDKVRTPADALATLAREHEAILRRAGLL